MLMRSRTTLGQPDRARKALSDAVAANPSAAARLRAEAEAGQTCGVIFGGERAGLDNDDVTLADAVLQAPLNPGFRSLNLGHAVMMICYEWYQAASTAPAETLTEGHTRQATKAELVNFFERLEGALDDSGFFHVLEKRPVMARNIRNIFQRSQLTDQELRTLHGIVSALIMPRNV